MNFGKSLNKHWLKSAKAINQDLLILEMSNVSLPFDTNIVSELYKLRNDKMDVNVRQWLRGVNLARPISAVLRYLKSKQVFC